MARWSDMQDHAKKIIDEGLAAIKSGVNEAGFLAETTASAARLHMDAGRKRFEIYRILHDLGALIYTAIKGDSQAQGVLLTPAMTALLDQARARDESVEYDEDMLKRFSIVRGEGGWVQRAPIPPRPERVAGPRPKQAQSKRPSIKKKTKPRKKAKRAR